MLQLFTTKILSPNGPEKMPSGQHVSSSHATAQGQLHINTTAPQEHRISSNRSSITAAKTTIILSPCKGYPTIEAIRRAGQSRYKDHILQGTC